MKFPSSESSPAAISPLRRPAASSADDGPLPGLYQRPARDPVRPGGRSPAQRRVPGAADLALLFPRNDPISDCSHRKKHYTIKETLGV